MQRLMLIAVVVLAGTSPRCEAQDPLRPIKKVEIGENREFLVNGKPFLPIMGWLQGPDNLPKLKAVGINTIAGYWRPSDGAPGALGGADAYVDAARDAGLYFIPPFDPKYADEMKALQASDNVLCWIHRDEPDKPETVSDAEITAGKGVIVNRSRPLWMMFDGDPRSSAVIDPMTGGQATIKLKASATACSVAVTNYVNPKTSVAKGVVFMADGKEILKATLEREKGRQQFELPAPATFQELTVKVVASHEAENKWGAIAEIEAFDSEGKNVLKSIPWKITRESAEEVMARYKAFKRLDPMRPIMMTVTCFFINDKRFDHWWTKEQADRIYPAMFRAADIPGHDVYPIYGWNQPKKIAWVTQGVRQLRAYAGRQKPTYIWLETLAGGKFGDKAAPVTGREIRNEVYQSIIQGATAIGYFTHRFKPKLVEFGVPPENQKAMVEINQQLQRLAPAILGADAKTQPKVESEAPMEALAKEHDGTVTLFAVNLDVESGNAAPAAFSFEGLKEGAIVEVVDESRTLALGSGGRFTDVFEPLAVHIYQIKP